MKLIFCPYCHDVVRLFNDIRYCKCGKIHGQYINNLDAVVSKNAIPIGINNNSFTSAINNHIQNHPEMGDEFVAFVFGSKVNSITRY